MKRILPLLAIAILVWIGWSVDPRALLAGWLAACWFGAGILLGGLANVWLHQLTGGAWGEAIRAPLLRAARWLPLVCLLFLPLLAGLHYLYPWTGMHGDARPEQAFRHWWLSPGFFILRALACLLLWSVLAWIEIRATRRSALRAAACLLLWVFSSGLAAVDWIMSLQPEWYSSVFGWLAGAGQMLGGMALALLLVDRAALRERLPDLANLLLMYVMIWGYLSYTQFLIIWAADLPREIAWYLRRSEPQWLVLAWVLVVFHLAAPLLLLLVRRAKRAPRLMGVLAGALLAAHLLDCWWLVLPSVEHLDMRGLWLAPALVLAFGLLAWTGWPGRQKEGSHA
jgi:hypothetical protein